MTNPGHFRTIPDCFMIIPGCYGVLGQGEQKVDQQWIISGAKQCSRHLNKKVELPFSFFLEQTK